MADLDAVESRLRELLRPYEGRLEPATIYGMPVLRRPGAKAHDWFAGVERTAVAVKLNFLPMYAHPELLDGISPALRRRKTGASVFKLTEVDEDLLSELESLLARAIEPYEAGPPGP